MSNFYGTTIYAAPVCGVFGSLIIVSLGLIWLESRRKKALSAGEGYGDHTLNEETAEEKGAPVNWFTAIIPLLVVLIISLLLSKIFVWNPNMLEPFKAMNLPLTVTSVAKVMAIWSLIIALVLGCVTAAILGRKNLVKRGLANSLNTGTQGSLLAIMNTASEVGYGNVISSLAGFTLIKTALMGIKLGNGPLVSEAISINVLAGITGSASGGMSIVLDLMGKDYLAWARQVSMSPEILHRIASMASGGLDTLPHNGAVITLLAVCGLTHRQSYGDIFVITCIKVLAVFAVIIFHCLTHLL